MEALNVPLADSGCYKLHIFHLQVGGILSVYIYAHTISMYILVSHNILNLHVKTSFLYYLQTRERYNILVQVSIIYTSSVNCLPNLVVLFIILNLLIICSYAFSVE